MKLGTVVFAFAASALLAETSQQQEPETPQAEEPSPEELRGMVARLTNTPTATVVYRGVSLIDGTGAPLRENMAIVVAQDRIDAVVPVADLDAAALEGSDTIDATGWYALPGLIDSHVHLATLPNREWAEAILYRQVYAGVTTVRDMAGDARALADLARTALLKQVEAPDIHYSAIMAGPSFFGDPRTLMSGLGVERGQVPWMQSMMDSTDLELAVARAKGTYATGIKIYANLPGQLVRNIIEEGHRQNIRVWTHAQVYPATPYDSIEGGADSISHVCMIPQYVLEPGTSEYSGEPVDMTGFSADDPGVRRVLDAMVDNDVILDATISMFVDDPEVAGLCPSELASALTHAAYRAGVRVAAGTDWSAPSDDRFPSLYRELEVLSELAEMDTMEVIRAATIHGAAALGLDGEIGTVQRGKLANLVFVTENPLADIGNLRSIVLTVKRGTPYPRDEYQHRGIPDEPDVEDDAQTHGEESRP